MGIRLSLSLIVVLTLSGCGSKDSQPAPATAPATAPAAAPAPAPASPAKDAKPQAVAPAPGAVVRVSTAPVGVPPGKHPPTAKDSLATKPNCGATQKALFLHDKAWACAVSPWKDLKKGAINARCPGSAPACDHDQAPACGLDGNWFCYDPKAQDAP